MNASATGGSGRILLRKALGQGHEVTDLERPWQDRLNESTSNCDTGLYIGGPNAFFAENSYDVLSPVTNMNANKDLGSFKRDQRKEKACLYNNGKVLQTGR